jgi:hypothetical protein
MTTQLSFSVNEHIDAETDKPVRFGTFSRDWAEEDELDELIDNSLEAGRISHNDKACCVHKSCWSSTRPTGDSKLHRQSALVP